MGSSCSSAAAIMPTKPGAECAICMDAIDHADHTTTNCGHAFCKGCIREWLESNMACPMCRTQVHTLDTPRSALRRADSRLRRERERKAHEAANMKRRAKERKAALKKLGGAHMRKEIASNLADIMTEMDEEETEIVEHAHRAVINRH